MRLGVHLPLADLGDGLPSVVDLNDYVVAARDLGFTTVAANDHLVWSHPWLDGTAALASVAASAGDMALATSITLPVIRHPAVVAKTLTTLAALTRGPVVGGLGPGSSRLDYSAVGIAFEERWARFDEALPLVRALVRGEPVESGKFYAGGYDITPRPEPRPSIWFASWGSDRRLAAMAAAADGWFASAYNATPDQYAEARGRLDTHLRARGSCPELLPRCRRHRLALRHRESSGSRARPRGRARADAEPGPSEAEAPADRQRAALLRGTGRLRRCRCRRGPRLAGARRAPTARAVRLRDRVHLNATPEGPGWQSARLQRQERRTPMAGSPPTHLAASVDPPAAPRPASV